MSPHAKIKFSVFLNSDDVLNSNTASPIPLGTFCIKRLGRCLYLFKHCWIIGFPSGLTTTEIESVIKENKFNKCINIGFPLIGYRVFGYGKPDLLPEPAAAIKTEYSVSMYYLIIRYAVLVLAILYRFYT